MTDRSEDAAPHAAQSPRSSGGRREFLKSVGALGLGLVAAQGADSPAREVEPVKLPQMMLGPHRISRLVCGANPFNAGSHLSSFVNTEMREFYTPEQVLKTLQSCEEAGISCWQISGLHNVELYRRHCDEGGKMKMISLGRDPKELPALREAGCIGVAHHGEVTDNLFKSGRLDEMADFLKRVHDAGMLAGISTHMPAVVDAVEQKGWEVDYYMTCVYERNRSEEDLKKLLGCVPIPVREVYLQEDPPRMYAAIRQARRPCLAFKILAAGRLSDRRDQVENAFRQTLQGIKPGDGIIIGIYDRYSNQPAEDAEFVRRYGQVG